MDSFSEKDLKKIFGRAFQVKTNWSTIDRLKIRQLSKAQKTTVNQHVQELNLQLSEDLLKIRRDFPNLKKIKICMAENQPKIRNEFPALKKIKVCVDDPINRNVVWLKELSLIKGLQELHLDTQPLVDAFAKAIRDPEIAEQFKNCTIYLKYCGCYYHQYGAELENIHAISTRLSNAKINVEYSVKEKQTKNYEDNLPKLTQLINKIHQLDNTSIRFQHEYNTIFWYTTMYTTIKYIQQNKTKILEAAFVGRDSWDLIGDGRLKFFLAGNSTLRSFSFGHPEISERGLERIGFINALSKIPELHWTMYNAKEWDIFRPFYGRNFTNLRSLTMAETLPLPQNNLFWQYIPNLRDLKLNLYDCTGTSLQTLKQLKNLRSLTINTQGKKVPLQGFPVLPWIATLCINANNVSVRDYQLQIFRQQTGLKKLSLEFGLLNISNLYFVNGLADLEVLKLKSVKHILNEIICFSQVKKLLNLREFHFSVYKDNMKHVEELKKMLPCKMCRLFIYNNNNNNNSFYNNNNNFYNNNISAIVFFGAEQRIVDDFQLDQLQQEVPYKYLSGFSEFL